MTFPGPTSSSRLTGTELSTHNKFAAGLRSGTDSRPTSRIRGRRPATAPPAPAPPAPAPPAPTYDHQQLLFEIQRLNDLILERDHSIRSLTKGKRNLDIQNEQLSRMNQGQSLRINDLERNESILNADIAQLRDKLTQFDDLTSQWQVVQKTLTTQSDEIARLRQLVADVDLQKTSEGEKYAALEGRLQDITLEKESLESTSQQLFDELQLQKERCSESLRNTEERLLAQNSELQLQINDYMSQLRSLQSDNDHINSGNSDLNGLIQRCQQEKNELLRIQQGLKETLSHIRKTNQDLSQQVDINTHSSSESASRITDLENRLQSQGSAAAAAAADADAAMAAIRTENEGIQAQLRSDNEALKENLLREKSQYQEKDRLLSREISNLQARLSSLQAQKESSAFRMNRPDEVRGDRVAEKLNADIRRLEKEKSDLRINMQNQLRLQGEEIKRLSQEKGSLDREKTDLLREKTELSDELGKRPLNISSFNIDTSYKPDLGPGFQVDDSCWDKDFADKCCNDVLYPDGSKKVVNNSNLDECKSKRGDELARVFGMGGGRKTTQNKKTNKKGARKKMVARKDSKKMVARKDSKKMVARRRTRLRKTRHRTRRRTRCQVHKRR